MQIIVEGVDNSGKSTLAFRLASDRKAVLVNNRHRPSSFEEVFLWTRTMDHLGNHHHVVYDRWAAISEPVYGPICRDTYVLSEGEQKSLYIGLFNTIVIYCDPGLDTILASLTEREQMEGVVENITNLHRAYYHQMEKVKAYIPVLHWDFTKDTYERLVDEIHHIEDLAP